MIFFYIKFQIYTLTGTVPDTLPSAYTTAALPQYAGGLYSPTPLTNNNLTATASIVAGKQIEGKFFFHLLTFFFVNFFSGYKKILF